MTYNKDNTRRIKRPAKRKKPKPREDGGFSFTTKRQPNKNTDEIKRLASQVFESDNEVESEIPIIEETNIAYKEIPRQNEIEVKPTPVQIDQGLTKSTAFVIKKYTREIDTILCNIFGHKNGDFFIFNENTVTNHIQGKRQKFRTILVEDKNGFRYNLWFDLTNLDLLSY